MPKKNSTASASRLRTVKLFRSIFKKALSLVPKTTVSTWADNYRMLSSEASSEPGRWQTSTAPYQKEIMDSFTQPDIQTTVVKSSSQIGKSDIMNNVIGRFAQLDPCPIMMVQPTIDTAEDFSKSRIAPMIRDTPVLRNLFREVKSRNSGNTILSKVFPGGRLIITGANSPSSLASKPIRILLCDEVDRFPASAGTEGDPISLASKRLTTFWNWRMGMFSTPTLAGMSRIEDEYQKGTQEEWQFQCPNCKEFHLVTHRNMHAESEQFTDAKHKKHIKVNSVVWRCPDCGFSFSETDMRNSKQKYIVQNPKAVANGRRSFFVNAFAIPWISWDSIMQEWLEAQGDPEQEKVITNTRFGESYEPRNEAADSTGLLKRRENYEAELPDGVLLLTAAVDTQDNRLEYEVCGWGLGEECWGINKGIILGVPDDPRTWRELDAVLDKVYKFKSKRGMCISRTFIDSGGHYSGEVYRYCQRNYHKQRFAVKGSSVRGVPLLYKVSKIKKSGQPLVMLGTDQGKEYVNSRLLIEKPGPKYFHFPLDEYKDKSNIGDSIASRGYDDIYFRGLLAEKQVVTRRNGQYVMTWKNVAKDHRNEPLDLRVYNMGCMQSLHVDFEALQEAIEKAAKVDALAEADKQPRVKKRHYGVVRGSIY